jgi:hypothetical protein
VRAEKAAAHPQAMSLKETIARINRETGLGFMKDRVKRNFDDLVGQEVVIEDIAFVASKFNDGAENVIFTTTADTEGFYRTGSSVVIQELKDLQNELDEEGLEWNVVGIGLGKIRSQAGRTYYTIHVRDFREE